MNGNADLLYFIYQNTEMGITTLEQILSIVKDEEFKLQLQSQENGYHEMNQSAKKLMSEQDYDEKGNSSFDKVKTYLMINLQTLTDKSNSHIADILIVGMNVGIVDATQKIRKYAGADKEIIKLTKKLLDFEEDNCKKLKGFL